MPNRNYNRGRSWEYKLIEELEKAGWTTIRSAQSRGPIDIFAGKAYFDGSKSPPGTWRRLAIQAKSGKSPFTIKDHDALVDAASELEATPILASRKVRKRMCWVLDMNDSDDRFIADWKTFIK